MKTVIVITLLCLFLFLPIPVRAQEEDLPLDEALSPTPVVVQEVEYTLPYPGLLPDNLLYPVKTARDRFVLFLIKDPLKKAEFQLLQADKRLHAAVLLAKKGKEHDELVGTTIGKAENYFSESIGQLHVAKEQGLSIEDLVQRMQDAAAFHEKALTGLEKNASKSLKESLNRDKKRVKSFQETLLLLEEKKK